MKINVEIVQKLNPCKERFNNFKENYPSFNGDLAEFLKLDKITYDDKVWVVTRLFTKKQNVKWAALCAESVLHIFEEKHPEDKRPRRAIEAALKGQVTQEFVDTTSAARAADAAYYAACAAADAAIAADYAAAYYAADAASAAAAYYAAAYYAADAASAADSAAIASVNKEEQQDLNLLLMLEV